MQVSVLTLRCNGLFVAFDCKERLGANETETALTEEKEYAYVK